MERLTYKGMRRLLKSLLMLTFATIVSMTLILSQAPLILKVDNSGSRFQAKKIDVLKWYNTSSKYCAGNYTGYGHVFFKLKSAIFDPEKNVFSITCNDWSLVKTPWRYWFYGDHATTKYTKSLVYRKSIDMPNIESYDDVTIVINREYPHNFFHAMTQWYNIYVLSKMFNFRTKRANILLLDRGPVVHIDAQWRLFYRNVIKANALKAPILLKNAVFNIPGHESLMYYFDQTKLPFIEEFGQDILKTFGLNTKQSYNCRNLTITLIIRHDYYMHPGVSTEKRIAERKIKNEEEIISKLQSEFPGHTVHTLIAEDTSLPEQLKITSNTDILIGMHGCVLSQILVLPKHAMVLEMYPSFWKIQNFFSSLARWRNIRHEFWQNKDIGNEYPNHYILIPESVIHEFAKKARAHFSCDK